MKNILITILFTIISATVFAQLPRAGSVVGLTNGDTIFQSPLSAIFSALGGGGTTINATDNYVPKRLNSGAFTNSLLFDNGSSVGIGTATPASKLDIEGSLAVGATYSGTTAAPTNGAIIEGNVGIGTSAPAFKFHTKAGTNMNFGVTTGVAIPSALRYTAFNDANSANVPVEFNASEFWFGPFGSERLRIATSGDIGIGVSAPSAKLHVLATTEQTRTGYDASNYLSTTIGSTGSATLNLVGTSPVFSFSDPVNVAGDVGITGNVNVTANIRGNSLYSLTSSGATTGAGFTSPTDGILVMRNYGATGFDRLNFGGTTSSFPSLKRSTTNLIARLADDSANTDIEVLDEAYDATTWNGSNEVPTKNALRDKIETLSSPTNKVTKGGDTDAATLVVGTNDSQELHLETGGTARVFVTTTGLVGIKEPSPATTLHVNGNIRGDGKVLIRGTGNTSALTASQLGFLNTNGSSTYDVLLNDAASLEFTSNTAVKTLSLTNSGATLGGGLTVATSTKTSSYTMAGTDYYIRIDGTSGANIITLPSATTGRVVKFKRVDNNPATAVGFIGTINGTANPTSLLGGSPIANMTAQHAFLELTYNGTDWDITGQN